MGYYKDEHMIISCSDSKPLRQLREELLVELDKAFAEDLIDYSNYVSPVLSLAYGSHWLYIPADGSKEGWETSNSMDEIRDWLRRWAIRWNARNADKLRIILVTDDDYANLSASVDVGEQP